MKNLFTLIFCIIIMQTSYSQWTELGSGVSLNPSEMFSISVPSPNVIWGTPANFGVASNIFTKSIDGGVSWVSDSIPNTSNTYIPLQILALDDQVAWVLFTSVPNQDAGRIFKTMDGGSTWTEQTGGFNQIGYTTTVLHFFNSNDGVTFGSPGTGDPAIDSMRIYTTSDGGSNWTRVDHGNLPTPLPGEGKWINSGNNSYEAHGDEIWFTSRKQRVYKSTNKGLTWVAHDVQDAGTSMLYSVAFQNDSIGLLTGKSPSYLAQTTDGGQNWVTLTPNVSFSANNIEYVPNTDNTYVAIDASGTNPILWVTKNGGQTWTNDLNPPSMGTIQFLSTNVGYGGTEITSPNTGGIYRWSSDLINGIIPTESNSTLTLAPNPATKSTQLTGINHLDIEVLNIYSITGKLVHQIRSSPSNLIDVSQLEKGLYYINVQLKNGLTHTKKLIII